MSDENIELGHSSFGKIREEVNGGKKSIHVQGVESIEINEDGELIEAKGTKTAMFEKEPPYVKMYLQDISRLQGLNPSECNIMYELLSGMGYHNVVPSLKPVKEMIALKCNTTLANVNKVIQGLYKKGILVRQARGVYIFDPDLFGRGAWHNVKKIRMTIDYNPDGTKTINSEVSQQLGLEFK